MSTGTPTSSGRWTFNVPPTWPAPPGFDPRKGHVADPTWPPAPAGWQFWVPTSSVSPTATMNRPSHSATYVPTARPGYQLPWKRIVLGGLLALVFGVRLVSGLFGGSSDGPSDGVGSCWTLESGTTYHSVPCSATNVQFRVVAVVPAPEQCPSSSDSYLDSQRTGSASRYECLVPA